MKKQCSPEKSGNFYFIRTYLSTADILQSSLTCLLNLEKKIQNFLKGHTRAIGLKWPMLLSMLIMSTNMSNYSNDIALFNLFYFLVYRQRKFYAYIRWNLDQIIYCLQSIVSICQSPSIKISMNVLQFFFQNLARPLCLCGGWNMSKNICTVFEANLLEYELGPLSSLVSFSRIPTVVSQACREQVKSLGTQAQ